jgi:hypothetical protein
MGILFIIYYVPVHYMLYMFNPHPTFLSRSTMFVRILLNILGSTVAQ